MAATKNNGPREPFGYKRVEGVLEPIPDQIEALKKAFWYLDSGCSYQTTRDWLVKKTGREISFIGLRKIWLTQKQEKES